MEIILEILTNFLFNDLATDLAIELLPTPGGPTRHKIGPFRDFVYCFTARYSKILSFTSSNP